jgi:hypothetical protein
VSGADQKSDTSPFPGLALRKDGGQNVCPNVIDKDIKKKIKYVVNLFMSNAPLFQFININT